MIIIELNKRYKKVDGKYIESPKGQYLGRKGPMGTIGLLNLGNKTPMGYPIDPETKKPYVDEGFDSNDAEVKSPVVTCPHCGKSF